MRVYVPNRFVDYLLVVGAGDKFVPQESVKNDLEVNPTLVTYKTTVVDRFPYNDYPDTPLPSGVQSFALPQGLKLDVVPGLPIYFGFVLTGGDGARVYGSCLTFSEELTEEELEDLRILFTRRYLEDQKQLLKDARADPMPSDEEILEEFEFPDRLFAPKCVCLLSHWPFYSAFKIFLTELYRVSISPSPLPIERYISNFMTEIPLPPLGKVQVQCSIGDKIFYVYRPPNNDLPLAEAPMHHLFQALNVDNILLFFNCVLTEKKILIVSSRYSLLLNSAETISALIFPFYWQHVYIPVLPHKFLDFLTAPVPFIMGIHSSMFKRDILPNEVVLVDLDNNFVAVPPEADLPQLPERQKLKLLRRLKEIVPTFVPQNPDLFSVDSAFDIAPPPEAAEAYEEEGEHRLKVFDAREVREQFLRFFESLFSKYRHFFVRQKDIRFNMERERMFKKEAFIRDQPEQARPFLRKFLETQAFLKFLEDKTNRMLRLAEKEEGNQSSSEIGDIAPGEYEVVFFDESIDAKHNRSLMKIHKTDTPFLKNKKNAITKTFVPPSPDFTGVAKDAVFRYDTFPRFKPENFTPPRPVKQLVEEDSAESIGVSTLTSWQTIIATLASLKKKTNEGLVSRFASKLRQSFIGEAASESSGDLSMDISISGSTLDRISETTTEDIETRETLNIRRIHFNTDTHCPACNHPLVDADIRAGWSWDEQDYRTTCPRCKNRFVARFSVLVGKAPKKRIRKVGSRLSFVGMRKGFAPNVSTSHHKNPNSIRHTFTGTPSTEAPSESAPNAEDVEKLEKAHASTNEEEEEEDTTLTTVGHSYEYLSPVLLKKEVENLLKKDVSCDENLFKDHPVTFWNLILHFRDLKIPLGFLLPQVDWNMIAESLTPKISRQTRKTNESPSNSTHFKELEFSTSVQSTSLSVQNSSASDGPTEDVHNS